MSSVIAMTPVAALADSFTITGNSSTSQTLAGTETGTLTASGSLSTSGMSVLFGIATGTGTALTNDGLISSSGNVFDTTPTVTGHMAVTSNGVISASNDGFRLNGTFAFGTLLFTNNSTFLAGSGQALDFDKATATSAVVTINNSGALSSNSDAVRLGGGTITLNNSGSITAVAAGGTAISFDTATNVDSLVSLVLTNTARGSITGSNDAIKIAGTAASTSSAVISINNAGTIESTGTGRAIDLGDLVSPNLSISITNLTTGRIQSQRDDAIKVGSNTTILNYGSISTGTNYTGIKFDGTSGTVYNYGSISGINAVGTTSNVMVTNYGLIQGANGVGLSSNGTGTVLNYGSISGSYFFAGLSLNGDGVNIDHIGVITNYGAIKGSGSKPAGLADIRPNSSDGIAIGGGTITNGSAGVRNALISGANNGILASDGSNGTAYGTLTVTNYGTIEGLNGYGIQIVNTAGTFGNTVVNYGTITGTTFAVAMGSGNDLFVYEAGSAVVGAVMAQGGTDTLRLGEVAGTFNVGLLGDGATYRGFEILDIQAGVPWTLTGISAFSGTTTVANTTLTLDNVALGSSFVTVGGSGSALVGTGTIGGLAAAAGATISPGLTAGSIGTLNVNGTASFASGSTYAVTVNSAGASDRIAVSGRTTLSPGATVAVQALPGSYDPSQSYTILTSAGGVSGTFGSVSSNMAFLTLVLSYDATDVYLAFARNDVSFPSVTTTTNARNAAAAVQAGGSGTALYQALITGTVASAQSAFQLLSGEAQASLGTTLFSQNQL
ncbi:hypothetical protein, partial [Azorhizobium sp. AG788]|uniref:beta strand repeat-containing protein n=1 Tax=Azorhizobium sp. AG788 TaxID=2183897 RepID=UPI003139FD19